ncbi:hypothetical protein MK338_04560, partial [Streptococcus vestibularis]|nr:hypothetical protein [Streptococcus vestibularis]
RQFDKV